MPERTASGYPVYNSDARALDVVSRLSGVNFGSVEKVFAAIDALQKIGLKPKDVVNLQNCPSVPVMFDASPYKRSRMNSTAREISRLVRMRDRLTEQQRRVLMLDVRFNPDGTPVNGLPTDT